jgi:hypothetical protein
MNLKELVKVGTARKAAWDAVTEAKNAAIASSLAWDNARRSHYLDLIDDAVILRVVEITSDERMSYSMIRPTPQGLDVPFVSQQAFRGVVNGTYRGRKYYGVWWTNASGQKLLQTLGDLERGSECRIVGIPYPSARLEDYTAVTST